jgi:hypothetical protein
MTFVTYPVREVLVDRDLTEESMYAALALFYERGGVIVPRDQAIEEYLETAIRPNGIKIDHEDGSTAPFTSSLMQETVPVRPDEDLLCGLRKDTRGD